MRNGLNENSWSLVFASAFTLSFWFKYIKKICLPTAKLLGKEKVF